jgi:putrescine transport system ATP-binding protein
MPQQTNYSDTPWLDADAEPFIKLRGVSKKFGEFTAVDNIDLDIYKGELFSLLGGSGCGKTTLLRMLAGFEHPSSGTIHIDGVDMTEVPPYARPINMMFQSYALFPHMTVEQNISYGLKRDKTPKDEIKRRVEEMLSMVELSDFTKRKPHQLSGGQRQRVALARALVKRPKVLLLDEPLGALDKRLREQTQFELINIQDQLGVTFIVVTHDQEEAMTLSTRMAMMDAGKFQQIGTPAEVYEYPESRLVANFIGSANMFEGRVSQSDSDHVVVTSKELGVAFYTDHAMSIVEGTKVWVAVRPENITLSKTALDATTNQLKGVVVDIGYHGKTSTYRIRISNGQIIEVSVPSQKRAKGDRLLIDWDEEIYLNWDHSSAVVLMK